MAGGDHLHFSILINDTFVNPVEWWDRKWIQNNVLSKIEWAKSITKKE
jgi:murein DD-endopeptidase MepM/ murein hydrolase activator NlpD